MKATHTLPLLLATSLGVLADAAPPVFTFTTGLKRAEGWWVCSQIYPDRPQGQSLSVRATSDGSVYLEGTCLEGATATVRFDRSIVTWSVGQDWWGCGRCASQEYTGYQPTKPRISCNVPFYTDFVPRYLSPDASFSGNAQTSWGHPQWENQGDSGSQESISANGEMHFTFCRDDFDASGSIDGGDLALLLMYFGESPNNVLYFYPRLDLDEDLEIGASDLALLLLDWGECPTPDA